MKASSLFLFLLVIQQALFRSIFSKLQEAEYSLFKRCCMTSNCRAPTVPSIFLLLFFLVKSWATPSSVSCSRPLLSCFVFIGSVFTTYLKSSGEKRGIPLKFIFSPSVSVSQIGRAHV